METLVKQRLIHPQTDKYRFWTLDEDIKLEKLLTNGKLSMQQIGSELGRSHSSCQSRGRALSIRSQFIRKTWHVNKSFWQQNTPEVFYWAGFWAADGSIVQAHENSFTCGLELQIGDINHLEIFKKACKFTGEIKTYKRPNGVHTARIRICDNDWPIDMASKFNLIPNKTNRIVPPQFDSEELMFSWIIGYTDGDGTIHFNPLTNQIQLTYVSASQQLIEWISSTLLERFPNSLRQGRKPKPFKHRTSNCWLISFSGVRAAAIIDFLSKFSVPKLSRKWENPLILTKINEYKRLYPDFFECN